MLNGTTTHPRDPTPWGLGLDRPGLPHLPARADRAIVYLTVGVDGDDVLVPPTTAVLDGTGGCPVRVPPSVPAVEAAPGYFRVTGSAHGRLPRDDRVFPLIEAMLALDIEPGAAGPHCVLHHAAAHRRG